MTNHPIDDTELHTARHTLACGGHEHCDRLTAQLDLVDLAIARFAFIGEWVSARDVEQILTGIARDLGLQPAEMWERLERMYETIARTARPEDKTRWDI
jgi:hypothetical protein